MECHGATSTRLPHVHDQREVMTQEASCATPREVWTLLEQTYASHFKARVCQHNDGPRHNSKR
jgi:hypothetical protein